MKPQTAKPSFRSLRERPPSVLRGYWILVFLLCLIAGIVSMVFPWFSAVPFYLDFIAAGLCLCLGLLTPRAVVLPMTIALLLGGGMWIVKTIENGRDHTNRIEFIFGFLALVMGMFAILIRSGRRKEEIILKPRPVFELPPEIQRLQKKHHFSYYFLLTFSTEGDAKRFWTHLSALTSPPSPLLALLGSWFSPDYGNARRWFVAWLCWNRQDSNAISSWEVSYRKSVTPAGESYGSPSSPLCVGFKLEMIAEMKEWT